MNDFMTRTFGRVRSSLAQIGPGQKIVIGMLAVALLMGGVFFTKWISAPAYEPLFSNLSSSDASAMVEELNATGVAYELADGGQTIMVDRDLVYATRLAMSGKGLPAGSETGYALLDKQGITTSEFQQQIDYQRALESELANTLQALDGVRTAVVHVALPDEDVFVSEKSKPTASVLLDLSPGTTLSATQIQAVTNLVSSSVEDLEVDQVTVADSTGAVLAAAGSEFGATAGAGDAQSQAEQDYQERLAANAQEILDRIMGPGNGVVRVQADLNFDARETTRKTYTGDPDTPPISESTTDEEYTGAGTPVGGVLGPTNPTGEGGGAEGTDYTKNSRVVNNSVNETFETIKNAPGSVDRLTVSVVVNEGTAVDAADLRNLVSNAVGLDVERGDAITVATIPLDTSAAEKAAADIAASREAAALAARNTMIRNGIIGGVIGLILLIAWWRSRRNARRAQAAPGAALKAEHQLELDAIRAEILARQNAAEDTETPERLEEAARRQKVRTEIATMISDSPDEVAAMLRGWLSEDQA
jgi:flagellar M-ring protein FliF